MRLYEFEDASSPYNKLLRQENKERKNDMKHLRKIFSLLLALVMVLGLATTAFAEGSPGATPAPKTYTIKIHNPAVGHTYEAYQVFKGDFDGTYLKNIDWGTGVDADALLAALKVAYPETCAGCNSAISVADVLKTAENVDNFAKVIGKHLTTNCVTSTGPDADGYYSITVTGDGYYFIRDTTDLNGENAAITKYIMVVTDGETIVAEVKPDTIPTITKTVDDSNDSGGNTSGPNSDCASYDIGDSVPFHLTITIPATIKNYDTYTINVTDTMSKGLTYNNDAKVMLGSTDVTSKFTISSVTDPVSGVTSLTMNCANVKDKDGLNLNGMANLKINYSAKLNEEAITGGNGNDNKVYMEFSNNPYDTQSFGKTPEDKVVVFTFKVIINKVTTGNAPLKGAAFKLEKKMEDGSLKTVKEFKVEELEEDQLSTFEFKGLDNGMYVLTETESPAGYNKIDPIEFRIIAKHEAQADGSFSLVEFKGDNAEITLTPDLNDGSLTGSVVNKLGNTLPRTGGIGTTIFYVVGIILVLGASVLLITKKRMESKR